MINTIFIAGLVIFALSSLYFLMTKKNSGINSAFLVSFVTLVSYVLMWDGSFVAQSSSGEPIFWTRWLFYALSCSLLMLEIAKVKGIKSTSKVAELIFLNVIVMGVGFLAAITSGLAKWMFFGLSSIAYLIQIAAVLKIKEPSSKWINAYIYFGWSIFPLVFFLAPTGIEVFGAAVAMGFYLVLDIYTKIVFNLQLKD
jgi:sensory rhodopsin